jgi:hypothetical protein
MPSDTNRIPYDEMRPKVDLIIEELRELMELLTEYRNHDFGRDIHARIMASNRVASCMVGPLIFTNPLGRCDEDGSMPWGRTLEAAEHLIGTLLDSVRQLRDMTDPGPGA